jgi:Tol biopolymer transport system component
MSSKLGLRLLLAVGVAGVLPACGNINDGNVLLIFTDRASVSSTGAEDSGESFYPAISADGRFIVFQSASNFGMAGVTFGRAHIFRRDTLTGTTILIDVPDSVTGSGTEGDADSITPTISGDGNRIAFASMAANLVGDDTNGVWDIYVRDVQAQTTTRVSVVSGTGAESSPSAGATLPAISQDGNVVAFASDSADLDPVISTSNGNSNIFRHEIATVETLLVSINTGAGDPDGSSGSPSISADGRFIAFYSFATDLVATDANGGTADVFVTDMGPAGPPTRVVSLVSVKGDLGAGGEQSDADSGDPSISADGRFVAFASLATNLDTNFFTSANNIYVRDTTGMTTQLISKHTSGSQANAGGQQPWISGDGRYVAFLSGSDNLVDNDTNGQPDAFWRDTVKGVTLRISVRTNGGQATGGASNFSTRIALSADGRFATYSSLTSDLISTDTNGVGDVFFTGPMPVENP